MWGNDIRIIITRSHTAEHCWKYNPAFDWEHKKVLDFEKNWKTRTIKEAICSEENEHHINGTSFKLPNILNKYYEKAKQRNQQPKIQPPKLQHRQTESTKVRQQVWFRTGRNIAKNLHLLNDVIRSGNLKNIEAAILLLDFLLILLEFLVKTLRHLNFGDYFVSWVQIISKDVTSQIKINGFLTKDIDISGGLRQGDPLSALFYVLIAG